jgi:hypothetical protein
MNRDDEIERLRAELADVRYQAQTLIVQLNSAATERDALQPTGLVSAVARNDDREVRLLFDTNQQAIDWVRRMQTFIDAARKQ